MTQPSATASELSDWVNPVAVREFRQAVQSRWVVAVLMLFLLVNLTIVGGFLLLFEARTPAGPAGSLVFGVLLSVLAITCLFFVPAYTGIRLSLERSRADIDLCFLTALSPGAIVRGKYLAAMALTLLIFSTCMPFMVVTYLLRGIDLPTIFWVLASCFVLCAAANAAGLCAGAVSGGWFLRGLAVVAVLWFLYSAGTGLLGIVMLLSYGNFSMYSAGLSLWATAGMFLLGRALVIGLMYVLAVALLSPPASNRMLVPRLYIAGAWVVNGCLAFFYSVPYGMMSPIRIWPVWTVGALCALAVAAVGERDTWGPRVRRTIPRHPLLRRLAFLAYTGSAGGLLYCTLLFAAAMATATAWMSLTGGFHGSYGVPRFFLNSLIGFGFVLCYCLTAAGLRHRFFPTVSTPYLSGLALLVGAATTLVPCLAVFFLGGNWWLDEPWALLASPAVIVTGSDPVRGLALVVLLGWFALSAVGAAPWFLGQWRRFTTCDSNCTSNPEGGDVP